MLFEEKPKEAPLILGELPNLKKKPFDLADPLVFEPLKAKLSQRKV